MVSNSDIVGYELLANPESTHKKNRGPVVSASTTPTEAQRVLVVDVEPVQSSWDLVQGDASVYGAQYRICTIDIDMDINYRYRLCR